MRSQAMDSRAVKALCFIKYSAISVPVRPRPAFHVDIPVRQHCHASKSLLSFHLHAYPQMTLLTPSPVLISPEAAASKLSVKLCQIEDLMLALEHRTRSDLCQGRQAGTHQTMDSNQTLALFANTEKLVNDPVWRGRAVLKLQVVVVDPVIEKRGGIVDALVKADHRADLLRLEDLEKLLWAAVCRGALICVNGPPERHKLPRHNLVHVAVERIVVVEVLHLPIALRVS